ncbi:MAG TPA: hypothetical protein VMU06_09785 [Stellaceae bacterium]|jgi:hypothetical protein|nr:hypothetical protein [Stellaceae bacterium]
MARTLLRALTGRGAAEEIRPGDKYRRQQGAHVVELVTVQDLRQDLLGIPHVLFKLVFECSHTTRFEEGSRILALSSFLNQYRERIG